MSKDLRLMFGEAWIYGLTLVTGLLLIVQGYGSGLTESLWGLAWGPLAWVGERVPLPAGAPFLLGTTGCVFVLAACFAARHD
ncbi:hypothetical protein DFP74_1059 [Nocardiopsis sp. Huas11]|uniref:hypothetical protein n=1 Tax=Nocardiopsis sp. Huas11 TaxID=2183912 RepID=UPI000EAD8016|nr:hypothetical protein [Nocardiopsis sp. Huas11]RKS05460.1 hypothetical protein DFP74_1059 [Nocardiopsis sp. Huas11]